MNYYNFHIGDYAAHTSHLSWDEDIAYRRMLDWYYLNERALPADPAKVSRLIRMPEKCRLSVQAVLDEFFVLSDDGWHSKRADEELTKMLEKQEQQSAKDTHEKERMRRYRERRAEMFAALRERGVVPAWDVPMKELQRLFDENCNAPVRVAGPLPATDEQRLSLPTPTPTPIEKKEIPARKRAAAARLVSVSELVADGVEQQAAEDWLTNRKAKDLPLTPTAWQQTKAEASKAGLTPAQAVSVAAGNGWAGFKATWAADSAKPRAGPPPMSDKFAGAL